MREEEEQVREQIESALERENLDREKALAASDDEESGASSSAILQGDIEQLRQKVERYQHRSQLEDLKEVKSAQETLVQCYKSVTLFSPLELTLTPKQLLDPTQIHR